MTTTEAKQPAPKQAKKVKESLKTSIAPKLDEEIKINDAIEAKASFVSAKA